jgi:hypothetical protein
MCFKLPRRDPGPPQTPLSPVWSPKSLTCESPRLPIGRIQQHLRPPNRRMNLVCEVPGRSGGPWRSWRGIAFSRWSPYAR